MGELRRELDRERRRFAPEPGGYARLVARRRRRRLARQMGSVVVALLLAGAGTWVTVRAFSPLDRSRKEPVAAGPSISRENVDRLRLAWTGATTPEDGWSIRVTSQEVLLSAPHEVLTAFPSSCGAPTCGVSWRASGLFALGKPAGPPPVVGGNAFGVSNSLAAYPLACGDHAAACDPAWTAEADPVPAWMTPLTVANRRLYAGTSDGRVLAFATTCPSASRPCQALWSTHVDREPVRFAPAVDRDNTYVVASRLYDLPAFCDLTGRCLPRWSAPIGPFASAPVAQTGWVYLSEGDRLLAYRASCGRGGETCQPAWTFEPRDGSLLSQPTVAGGVVSVTGARLYALPADCGVGGGACAPLWTAQVSASSWKSQPVPGNGLVFVVSADRVLAFADDCGSDGDVCQPVWASTALEPGLAALGVGRHGVFAIGPSGTLYVFEVPTASSSGGG